jgi:Ankyrin repeats (many copies)
MLYATIILLLLAGELQSQVADPYESALVAAIHHFAREGELDHLEAILEKHPGLVDVAEPFPPGHKPYSTEGYTPLDWAAVRGHAAVAKYLIRRGANVNAADGAGWTPLHLAAQKGHLELVKLLVKSGADVEAKTAAIPESSSDSQPGSSPVAPGEPARIPVKYPAIPSRTALDWADAMKHANVVEYLKSLKK